MNKFSIKESELYPAHVLIVDDDRALGEMLMNFISKCPGFDCSYCDSAREALQTLEKRVFDVVVTDIKMPDMSGLELTRIIKEKYDSGVIVVTGYYEDFTYEQAIENGANDFIEKPVRPTELIIRLKRILRERAISYKRWQAEESLRESEEAARRLAQENDLIAEIGRIIGSTLTIDEVYERFAEKVKEVIPFDAITINLVNMRDNTRTIQHHSGIPIEGRKIGDVVPLGGSVSEGGVRARSSLLINVRDNDELLRQYPGIALSMESGIQSRIVIPLMLKDEVVGTLLLRSLKPDAYTENDLRLAERVGAQIAGTIANAQLFLELKNVKKSLQQAYDELEVRNKNLEEMNIALHVLLQKREEDKRQVEERIVTNIRSLVYPYLAKLHNDSLDETQHQLLNIIESHLNELLSPLLTNLQRYNLTPREVLVAALVKDGNTTKDIAKILGVETSSIDDHRNNIRKKLGLSRNVNLQAKLQSLK